MKYSELDERKYKIISWNVGDLKEALGNGFLRWMEKESPDILCLQETQFNRYNASSELRNPGQYKSFWKFEDGKGGLAVYSKIHPNNVYYETGIAELDKELKIIIMQFDNFYLINTRFPSGNMKRKMMLKMDLYKTFLIFLKTLQKEGKQIIVCVDFNSEHDIAKPRNDKFWINETEHAGFLDSFRNSDDFTDVSSSRVFISKNIIRTLEKSFIVKDSPSKENFPISISLKM